MIYSSATSIQVVIPHSNNNSGELQHSVMTNIQSPTIQYHSLLLQACLNVFHQSTNRKVTVEQCDTDKSTSKIIKSLKA